MLNVNTIERQWNALGQSFYDVGMINEKTKKKMADMRSWPQMLQKLQGHYQDHIDRGENLYIRGIPDAEHDILFLDDVTEEGIAFLAGRGFPAACIAESSHGNFQMWPRLGFPAPASTRKICERVMIAALDAAGIPGSKPARNKNGADTGSNDGQHYGRLASSRHQGSGFTVRLVDASGEIMCAEAAQALVQQAAAHAGETLHDDGEIIELRELLDMPYQRPEIERDIEYFSQFITTPDQSKADYFLSCRLAKKGYSVSDIAKALAEFGPNNYERKDRSAKNPNRCARYLQSTARKAVAQESR